MARLSRILAFVLVLVAAALPARAVTPCARFPVFADLPGASLTPTDHLSNDGVAYVMYRGTAPSFDGMPMSVDVTIPCSATGAIPLVAMNHGWTDDKTIWEETGRSDTVSSEFRRASNHHWNNIWFASRGYAVLNYTARGWHDSCGPQTPGAISNVAPAPQCANYAYWIHMSDQRWEARDVAWLTAELVQSGVADPDRLAITGGSYGGGATVMNALLHDRIVCGGMAVPASFGTDPCVGKADGEYVPWRTRDGRALAWAVAVPMYTWGDVLQVLLPNGRGSDGDMLPDGDHLEPIGVPISSYLAGLYAAGQPLGAGYYAPPGIDPTADITTQTARTLAGNPFRREDPIIANGLHQFSEFKSSINIALDGTVPIFWVQGFTDPLFSALEPLQIANKVRARDADYPIKLFFGDLGHDYASERVDEWDAAHAAMNAFVDHYLTGAGAQPSFDVTAAITRCLNHDAPMELVTAADWPSLHPGRRVFVTSSDGLSASQSQIIGEEGLATDPVSTASVPGPQSYKGCRIMSPARTDDNAIAFSFPTASDVTLLGGPVVAFTYASTGVDSELNVRLWDVTEDGSAQALVTRGTYRSLDGPGTDLHATFQISPTGYRFGAGHTIKLEVTANDAPYRQQSNLPFTLRVSGASLTLPTP